MIEPTPMSQRRRLQAEELDQLTRDTNRILEASMGVKAAPPDDPLDDDAQELRQLTADAVMAQYEAAAKAVENMGEEVKGRITKLQNALDECHADLKLIDESAAVIRDKGKHAQAIIDEMSSLSSDIRKTCAEFRKKVQVPT
jgi:uncharacterized coiled-coil DUF342 family protein